MAEISSSQAMIFCAVISLLLSLWFLFLAVSRVCPRRPMIAWAWYLLLQAAGFFSIALKNSMPELYAAMPGSILLVASSVFLVRAYNGVLSFHQQTRWIFVLIGLATAGLGYFSWLLPHAPARVALSGIILGLVSVHVARVLVLAALAQHWRIAGAVATGFIILGVAHFTRFAAAASAWPLAEPSKLPPAPTPLLVYGPLVLWSIVPSLGFLAMQLDRLRREQQADQLRTTGIVDSVDGIVWEADARTVNFTFVSGKAIRLLGYSVEEWLTPGFWIRTMHPDDVTWVPEYCQAKSRELAPHEFEYRLIAKDGHIVWLRDIVSVAAEDGKARWLRGVMIDITESKKAAEKLQRLTFMYELLSNCRRIISQTSTESDLFSAIVRLCVTNNYIKLAWIGLPEDDSMLVRIAAAAGSVTAYLDDLRVSMSPRLAEGCGPTGTAMRELHDIVVNYPDRLPADQWSERRQKHGLHSYAAITFRLSGVRMGSLNLYAAEEGFFTADIIGLFDQLGTDLSAALDRIEAERWRSFAEQSLRENQMLLDFALEATVDAVWDYHVPSGTVRFFRHWEAMLGYEQGELQNDPLAWEAHVHPDDLRASDAMLESYRRGDIPAFDMRIRLRNKFGNYLWVKDRGIVVERDESGEATRIIGTLKNIDAEVKKAEESLQNAALLDAIFDASPVAIAVLNHRRELIKVNPAVERIARVANDADLKKAIAERMFFYPDGQPYPRGDVPAPLALPRFDQDYSAVFGFRDREKEDLRWVSMTTRYLADVGLVVCISTDITSVIESETALRESEQKFRNIFESAPIGITLFNSAGAPISLNPEVKRQSEIESTVSMDDVADWHFIDESGNRISLEDMPLSVSVREKRPVRDFIFGRQFSEKVRWFTSTVVPMTEIGMYAGYLVELTDLVNAKREISGLASTLEETVAQRTRELQEINAELEAFSYSLSHDLKAPLTRAESWLNILDHEFRSALGEKGKGMLVYVRNEIGAMKRMNEAMLALSRVARLNIQPVEASLTQKAQEIVQQLREENSDKVIELALPEYSIVYADPELLRILIRNLLENAVKFSRGKDPIRIEISCAAERQHFLCAVRDNGVGFDMQYADKLFAPFQRLHAEGEFPGTGIGLATAQRIVHRHGGKIWAQSQPGVGTTIYFTLPRGGETP